MEPDTEGANVSTVSGSRHNPGALVWKSQPWYSLLLTPAAQAGHNNGVSANSAPTAWLCGTSQGKSQQTRTFRSGCRPHPQIMKDENEKVLQCIVWAMESLVC